MTRKQNNAKKPNWKEVLAEQEDFLRPLIQEVVQQVLEAEMEEALGAGKGRAHGELVKAIGRATTDGRWSRGSASLSCECRRTGRDDFGPRFSNAISGVKKRWWRR